MTRIFTNRWIHILILLGLLGSTVLVRIHDYEWIKALRYIAFDTYNKMDPREPTDRVVMVDIDEDSLRHEGLGQWPWPRSVMASLVTRLHELGAKVIIFDIVFSEDDRTSPSRYLKTIPAGYQSDAVTQTLSGLPDNDDLFAASMAKAGNVVTGFTRATAYREDQRIPYLSQPIQVKKSAGGFVDSLEAMLGVSTNLPVFAKASAGNGSFAATPELDGLLRRVSLVFRFVDPQGKTQEIYPALSTEALRVMQGAKTKIQIRDIPADQIGLLGSPYEMKIGDYEIPMNKDGRFYVYFSKARPDKYIPVWKIMDKAMDPAAIKDKIVIIGTSAEGLRDIRSTPLDLFVPGSEVHINVMEQILTGSFLLRPEVVVGGELIFVVFTGLLIIFLAPFIGTVFMALFTLALISSFAYASWYSFETHSLLLDPVYPSLCLLTLFIMSSLLTYIRTESERKHVREAFGFYISPDFMEELTKDPDKLKLGGEVKELTVMFTDIRGFTSISETMTPEALIQLMNDFLTPMSDLVMSNRGTIDKYMGDAMMAFWNAPLDDPRHAHHACMAALKMNKALIPINDALKAKAAQEGKPPVYLEAGIGINTGMASVGNMGSKNRFAYSALGDTVNLSSRLEGQTKQYGVRILLGEKTRLAAPEFAALELDLIRVKGKREPERIFVLLGDEEMAQGEYFKDWKEKHDKMLECYRAMKWDESRKLADQCRNISKEGMQMFYNVFITRLAEMKANPPKADWGGVFVATSK